LVDSAFCYPELIVTENYGLWLGCAVCRLRRRTSL
jgi:hypothetical protein